MKYNSYDHQKNYLRYRTYREISNNPDMASAYWIGITIGAIIIAALFGLF